MPCLGQLFKYLQGMLTTSGCIAMFSEVDPVQKRSIPGQRIGRGLVYVRSTLYQSIVGRHTEQDCLGATVSGNEHRFAGFGQLVEDPPNLASKLCSVAGIILVVIMASRT